VLEAPRHRRRCRNDEIIALLAFGHPNATFKFWQNEPKSSGGQGYSECLAL
jgi:hypothetical protein